MKCPVCDFTLTKVSFNVDHTAIYYRCKHCLSGYIFYVSSGELKLLFEPREKIRWSFLA